METRTSRRAASSRALQNMAKLTASYNDDEEDVDAISPAYIDKDDEVFVKISFPFFSVLI